VVPVGQRGAQRSVYLGRPVMARTGAAAGEPQSRTQRLRALRPGQPVGGYSFGAGAVRPALVLPEGQGRSREAGQEALERLRIQACRNRIRRGYRLGPLRRGDGFGDGRPDRSAYEHRLRLLRSETEKLLTKHRRPS